MLARFRAQLDSSQPVAGKGANIQIIHVRALRELLRRGHKLRTGRIGEFPSALLCPIRGRRDAEANVLVSLRVFPGDRTRADDSYSHRWSDSRIAPASHRTAR